jgi:hypothetical protein
MEHASDPLRRSGAVLGKVEFREGEGIMLEVPRGAVEVAIAETDVTLSWMGGDYLGPAAIPYPEFCRYVMDGAIALE